MTITENQFRRVRFEKIVRRVIDDISMRNVWVVKEPHDDDSGVQAVVWENSGDPAVFDCDPTENDDEIEAAFRKWVSTLHINMISN